MRLDKQSLNIQFDSEKLNSASHGNMVFIAYVCGQLRHRPKFTSFLPHSIAVYAGLTLHTNGFFFQVSYNKLGMYKEDLT